MKLLIIAPSNQIAQQFAQDCGLDSFSYISKVEDLVGYNSDWVKAVILENHRVNIKLTMKLIEQLIIRNIKYSFINY